jgi:Prokaryotic N-terminal methylation motif
MNRRRRGLTLVEVVSAAALLAVLSIACVPMIRGLDSPGEHRPPVPIEALADFADAVLESPERFGVTLEALANRTPVPPLDWPDAPSIPSIVPARVEAIKLLDRAAQAEHVWLIFECAGTRVARSIAVFEATGRRAESPRWEPRERDP